VATTLMISVIACGALSPPRPAAPAGFACPKVRVPPVDGAHGTPTTGRCRSDGDCVERADGRCVVLGDTHSARIAACVYDGCTGDRDCRAGETCVCGTGVGPDRNRCMPGNCHTDVDCAGTTCGESMSTFVASDYARHVEGHFCRTREDTCRTDHECDLEGRHACAYRAELGRWTCVGITYGARD
jgi:hypothetical protein